MFHNSSVSPTPNPVRIPANNVGRRVPALLSTTGLRPLSTSGSRASVPPVSRLAAFNAAFRSSGFETFVSLASGFDDCSSDSSPTIFPAGAETEVWFGTVRRGSGGGGPVLLEAVAGGALYCRLWEMRWFRWSRCALGSGSGFGT